MLSVRYDAEKGCSVVEPEAERIVKTTSQTSCLSSPVAGPLRVERGGGWEGETAAGAA